MMARWGLEGMRSFSQISVARKEEKNPLGSEENEVQSEVAA